MNFLSNTVFAFRDYLSAKGFSFIHSAEDILREILHSKENGNVIGIQAETLGNGIYVTGVEDVILDENETAIILKPYDMSGYIFPNKRVPLDKITLVCPLRSPVKNPFLQEIEKNENRWLY
jgi:hypothetical protein